MSYIDYKTKYHKYKTKYLNFIKQNGAMQMDDIPIAVVCTSQNRIICLLREIAPNFTHSNIADGVMWFGNCSITLLKLRKTDNSSLETIFTRSDSNRITPSPFTFTKNTHELWDTDIDIYLVNHALKEFQPRFQKSQPWFKRFKLFDNKDLPINKELKFAKEEAIEAGIALNNHLDTKKIDVLACSELKISHDTLSYMLSKISDDKIPRVKQSDIVEHLSSEHLSSDLSKTTRSSNPIIYVLPCNYDTDNSYTCDMTTTREYGNLPAAENFEDLPQTLTIKEKSYTFDLNYKMYIRKFGKTLSHKNTNIVCKISDMLIAIVDLINISKYLNSAYIKVVAKKEIPKNGSDTVRRIKMENAFSSNELLWINIPHMYGDSATVGIVVIDITNEKSNTESTLDILPPVKKITSNKNIIYKLINVDGKDLSSNFQASLNVNKIQIDFTRLNPGESIDFIVIAKLL